MSFDGRSQGAPFWRAPQQMDACPGCANRAARPAAVLALDPLPQNALKLFKGTGELWVRAEIADGFKNSVFFADREFDGRALAEPQASLDLSGGRAGRQGSKFAGGLHLLVKSVDETFAIARDERDDLPRPFTVKVEYRRLPQRQMLLECAPVRAPVAPLPERIPAA